jgi:hypothetical protein
MENLKDEIAFYSLKHVGQNLALLVQEFIMISFLRHLDIIRFNQAYFDISFLPLRPFLSLRETSFGLRIYLPPRRQCKQEEEKEEFF